MELEIGKIYRRHEQTVFIYGDAGGGQIQCLLYNKRMLEVVGIVWMEETLIEDGDYMLLRNTREAERDFFINLFSSFRTVFGF